MKKILSFVLSFVILMTTVPFVSAEDSTTYKVGDIIQFGSYPQTEVKDIILLSELNALAPEWDEWTSYGYYSGNGSYGSMVQGDWMKYIDILYNGLKYRGVMFTQYRPNYTINESSNNLSEQKNNNYYLDTIYWFKFESIDWRVLEPSGELLLCETIIDSQPYSNTIYRNTSETENRYAYFNDPVHTNYASDYSTSSIREWLNNDFFNTAFTDNEKSKIKDTVLENEGYFTSINNIGFEKLDSSATNDKVFLLSYTEVLNNDFGFSSVGDEWDISKRAISSDYAKSQGLWVEHNVDSELYNKSYWTLRTAADYSYKNCTVSNAGYTYDFWQVYSCDNGVRPALRICNHKYTSEITTPATHLTEGVKTFICACGDSYTEAIAKLTGHTYEEVVTEPTCTTQGYTTYTCACGDTYVDDYTEELDHEYTSEITTPATHLTEGVKTFTCKCGDTYTEPVAKLEGHTYTSEVTKEATHLAEGETTYICACGDTYTEVIAKLTGHTYEEFVTAPTCTAKGYTTYICACGESYTGAYVGEKGHSYASTVTTPATHTKEGVLIYTCTECGDSYTDKIDKTTEHSYNEQFVAPSCTETGYTVYTCACGDTYIRDYISETGHNDNNNDGTCDDCGIKLSTTDNENCSCNCHKSGIMGIIWKILRFFYKLFGTNKTCGCGVAHY